jgi:DNA-binding winged helix-turn-helix (wHTH) protein/TolB-like protein
MDVRAQSIYEFGRFRLNAMERLLTRDGEVVPLTPKVFDLLIVLVENNGHMVDKDELMRALWRDTFVEEGNLTQNVSTLRKALGESQNGYHFIETVPKRGYRFVADLGEASENDTNAAVNAARLPDHQSSARRSHLKTGILVGCLALIGLTIAGYALRVVRKPAPTVRRSIAVLPFRLVGGVNGDESVVFGMTNVLINRLINIKSVQVRPARPVSKYSGIHRDAVAAGRELGVDVVVDVDILRNADSVRVNVQLVGVEGEQVLHGLTFEEKFTDWIRIERRICDRLADFLRVELLGDEGRLFTQAIERDDKLPLLTLNYPTRIFGKQ